MRKIKVLEIIDQPFLGGGQVNLLSLAESLAKEMFEVAVCSRGGGPLAEAVQKLGIPHFAVSFRKALDRSILREIRAVLADHRFDIVHTHGGVAGIYGRLAAHQSVTPVVIHTLHGIHYLHYRNVFTRFASIFLERYFSRFTNALIFVSDSDKKKGEKFKLASSSKMVVIKNGIDFSACIDRSKKAINKEIIRRDMSVDKTHQVVGTVARLHRQKGLLYLLQAAEIISRTIPSTRFVVAGGGPLKRKLEMLNRQQGLENVVRFLGERTEALEILSLFDIFVLPSLWEGLPYALLEAAALAKPVVASNVDGISELIQDGKTGILVPARNPERLAGAIIELLQDRRTASYLGENLQASLSKEYTLTRMIQETQALYLDLFNKTLKT